MEVRTRYAPSPTGPLHLGGARTALFNYLFSKKHRGNFILRIEDTDVERSRSEFEKDIKEGLEWLGLKWDKFYRQSERQEIYRKYIKKLLASDLAYVSEEETGESKSVLRFRNPGKKVSFSDLIRGTIEFDTRELGDFIIARDELRPLFHMTVVVDDYEMGISHVIRGEDHISNTPRQILIQEALGFSRPKYAHLPLILGPDRTKLSKRHGAESLSEYRKDYLPEAIFNFLAFLGWHPKDDREILTKEELINEFSLERVQKGGAIFDTRKLEWMNTEYIRKKSPKELLVYFKDIGRLDGRLMSKPDDLEKIIALEQPRLKKLSELPEKTAYFFEASEYPKELLRWKGTQNYQLIRKHLEKIIELWPDSNKVMSYADKEGRGEVLWPFRVALSGRETSPGPFEIGEILGREETLRRIKKALELLG